MKNNIRKFIIFTIFFFCLLTPPSFALSSEEVSNLFLNENYTIVLIELPQFMHRPDVWNEVHTRAVSTKRFLKMEIDARTISRKDLNHKSIPEVAEMFGGFAYVNSPEYAYSKIILPKENYENLTKTFRSLGFKVRDNIPVRASLSQSRSAIELPYRYHSGSWSELTGKGGTIAIIDSGIDDTHADFPAGKVVFWNDTSHQDRPCCVDEYGHGTHVASIAAGTGAASGGLYKGVAPDADLKIWKASVGAYFDVKWVADSVGQAVREGADVISMSLGMPATRDRCIGGVTGDIQELYDNIDDAIQAGIIVVAAAGNSGPTPGTIDFPGCIDDVITVGATLKKDYVDHRWGYSPSPIDTAIQFSVNVTTENWVPIQGAYGGSRTDWSGFQYVIRPNVWPARIEVKVEGQNRYRDCFWTSEKVTWDPGGPVSGDEYWTSTKTFFSGSYVVVEIFNLPHINEWTCPEIVGKWHHYYTEDRIYVNIFRTDSLTTEGLVSFYSSRGPPPQGGVKPDVTAPGHKICAAKSSQIDEYMDFGEAICGNDQYVAEEGTSMATPHVAGLVVLIKEATSQVGVNPSSDEIKDAIKEEAYNKYVPNNPDNIEGHGRISVTKTVDFITDCDLKPSYDIDAGDRPLRAGSCYDYTTWSGDSCSVVKYDEYCSGNYLYEYWASGTTCSGDWINCEEYGSDVICYYDRCKYSTDEGGIGGGGSRHKK